MKDYFGKQQKEEKLEVYRKAHCKLVELNEEVSNLVIRNLKQNKTVLLLGTTRNYLEIYKTGVPEILKKKFKFDIKSLEEKLKIAEESIEILRN